MPKKEDPPLQWIKPEKAMAIWIVSVILILIGLILFLYFAKVPEEEMGYNLSEYLIAQAPHSNIKGEVRGNLIDRIIWCESKNVPTAQNPKSTAYGICQFIDGTWDYVQEKWDMELNREEYCDQYYACERLLREEGTRHWKSSKLCWSK